MPCTARAAGNLAPGTYEIFRLEASSAERTVKLLQRQLAEKQLWQRLNWSCSGKETNLMVCERWMTAEEGRMRERELEKSIWKREGNEGCEEGNIEMENKKGKE